jgi:hypothetical protein
VNGDAELSVLLATDDLSTVTEMLARLRAQRAAQKIELVLAVPRRVLEDEETTNLNGFHSVRVVDADPADGTAAARAAAVFAASAPVVVQAETHCFPEPGWAEALIGAHREPWAGVGPELCNDNPESATSWGGLLVDYYRWVAPATPGPADDIPGHNSSYKRSVLLEYGSDLPRALEVESVMHWDLRAKGHRLCMEPRAKVRHRNITRPAAAIAEHFHSGRLFGASRARSWHLARRILHAVSAPLVPIVRMTRVARKFRQKGERPDLPRGTMAMAFVMFIAHATGEVTGYFRGSGHSAVQLGEYEVHKNHYVRNLRTPLSADEPSGIRDQ